MVHKVQIILLIYKQPTDNTPFTSILDIYANINMKQFSLILFENRLDQRLSLETATQVCLKTII